MKKDRFIDVIIICIFVVAIVTMFLGCLNK